MVNVEMSSAGEAAPKNGYHPPQNVRRRAGDDPFLLTPCTSVTPVPSLRESVERVLRDLDRAILITEKFKNRDMPLDMTRTLSTLLALASLEMEQYVLAQVDSAVEREKPRFLDRFFNIFRKVR